MRVHHLDCVSLCPIGGSLMDGRSRSLRGRLTCHCLLVETRGGLVLIDTGLGMHDVASPQSRLSRFFLWQLAPDLRKEATAVRQIEQLGFRPSDVRHIVLTHLDFDHAGGLDDFPYAVVHLLEAERNSAMARRTAIDKRRYRPQQWSTMDNWHVYRSGEGEPFMGFDCVRDLTGLPPEILLVPLIGHTMGHAGVAVRAEDRWLLHAGDAYYYYGEMNTERPHCTSGLRAYQRMMDKDRQARVWNQDRLRALKRHHGHEIEIFCTHDLSEFERYATVPEEAGLPPRRREEQAETWDRP